MSLELARTVADAVLYEGYLLYPYRASSSKNQIRWQFGVLGPPGASLDGFGEESGMHAETLLDPHDDASVSIHLRFLQLQARCVEKLGRGGPGDFVAVGQLTVGDTTLLSWDEAVEGGELLGPLAVAALAGGVDITVDIPGGEDEEPVLLGDGQVVGRVIRRRWPLLAEVHLAAVELEGREGTVRLVVDVKNVSETRATSRDEATRVSFLGAHLLMQVSNGAFVSLLEPPEEMGAEAAACRNERCWPVLVGVEGQTDIVLASPIILYDYPALAPESAGALFDSTEIDEILTLRVMTLTNDEKAAARATDPAAAAIIDRCEQMSPEAMAQLHGVLRDPHATLHRGRSSASRESFDANGPFGSDDGIPTFTTPGSPAFDQSSAAPWWDPGTDAALSPTTDAVTINGVAVARGSSVKLHPSRNADAQDLFFAERTATVSAVFFDVDGATHVAVVIDDDPAADLHEWYGRYLYFAPEEIEPLDQPSHR